MFRYFLIILCLLLSGCTLFQQRKPPLKQDEPEAAQNLVWTVLDYRNKNLGAVIPAWVDLHLRGSGSSIERLAEFQNYYVFVSSNTGTNFSALNQWNSAFSPDLDFARLAAARIEKRMLDAAARYPDDEYGSYFEKLVRAASDAEWKGAARRADFWLYRRFPDPDDPELPGRENYDFFILVIIEKELLVRQITELMAGIVPDEPLSRDQRNAVTRIRERFFEGF